MKRNCVVSAALLNGDKRVPLKVVINGDDFASSVANETWFIHAQGHDWISDNGGKNWRATGPDPALCNLVLGPLTPSVSARDGYQPWRVESLGIETVNGEQRLHLRLRPPGKQNVANDDVPNYWLASDGKGGWVIRRFVGAVVFMNSALSVDAVYDHIGLAAKINPPVRP